MIPAKRQRKNDTEPDKPKPSTEPSDVRLDFGNDAVYVLPQYALSIFPAIQDFPAQTLEANGKIFPMTNFTKEGFELVQFAMKEIEEKHDLEAFIDGKLEPKAVRQIAENIFKKGQSNPESIIDASNLVDFLSCQQFVKLFVHVILHVIHTCPTMKGLCDLFGYTMHTPESLAELGITADDTPFDIFVEDRKTIFKK